MNLEHIFMTLAYHFLFDLFGQSKAKRSMILQDSSFVRYHWINHTLFTDYGLSASQLEYERKQLGTIII